MNLSFTWVDWIIVCVIVYFVIDGWEKGVIYLFRALFSFLASLWLAVKYQNLVGAFLLEKFGIPSVWTNVLGYLIVATASELVISEILTLLLARLPGKFTLSKVNNWLGAILSAVNSLVVMAFVLLVVLSLPIRGTVKQDIKKSVIASKLVSLAEKYGGKVKSSLDEVTKDAIGFLTIKPQSSESIRINVGQNVQLEVDQVSQEEMVKLVSLERNKVGLQSLQIDSQMSEVARAHSKDMFEKHYFSHYDTTGRDAAKRMSDSGIAYNLAGENLAYAADIQSAHAGLMQSEGHRKNILNKEFKRIGVGVIDAGVYGKMFTELFAD